MRVPGLGQPVSLALCAPAAAIAAAYRQRGDDPAWIVRAHPGAEEPGDDSQLASLSRSAGAGPAVCGKFFLPGLSVHAGAPDGAALFQAAIQLAARAPQQVAFGRALRADSFYSTNCSTCGRRPGGPHG